MLTTKEIRIMTAPALAELGLKEQETDLYCLALALGPAPIRILAEHLGIPGPNVYKIIAELEKHGLTSFSQQKKYGRRLTVVPPATIAELLEKKRVRINDLRSQFVEHLPDLLTNYHQGDTPTKIRILQGAEQYRQALDHMFNDVKDELLFYGSVTAFTAIIPPVQFADMTRTRIARSVRLTSLMYDEPLAKKLAKNGAAELRDVRFLPGPAKSRASFQLSLHRAIVWQPEIPLAVFIEDASIVTLLRSMFFTIWDSRL